MNPIQYTSVFRGVVLVQVPMTPPKAEVPPPAPPEPAKSPAPPSATLDTVA